MELYINQLIAKSNILSRAPHGSIKHFIYFNLIVFLKSKTNKEELTKLNEISLNAIWQPNYAFAKKMYKTHTCNALGAPKVHKHTYTHTRLNPHIVAMNEKKSNWKITSNRFIVVVNIGLQSCAITLNHFFFLSSTYIQRTNISRASDIDFSSFVWS